MNTKNKTCERDPFHKIERKSGSQGRKKRIFKKPVHLGELLGHPVALNLRRKPWWTVTVLFQTNALLEFDGVKEVLTEANEGDKQLLSHCLTRYWLDPFFSLKAIQF